VLAFNVSTFPLQTGLFEPAIGFAGVESTTISTVPSLDLQLLIVTFTRYVPLASVLAFGIEGFCDELLNPFGPDQLQVGVPPVEVVLALKLSVLPLHIGETEGTVGIAGGLGSTKLTGPTLFEGQLENST
jgi:hypothetical protein